MVGQYDVAERHTSLHSVDAIVGCREAEIEGQGVVSTPLDLYSGSANVEHFTLPAYDVHLIRILVFDSPLIAPLSFLNDFNVIGKGNAVAPKLPPERVRKGWVFQVLLKLRRLNPKQELGR